MIDRKTPEEIEMMAEGGKRLGGILTELLDMAQVGVSLLDIEALAIKRIREEGGTPSFQTVKGYKWATCLCVNDVVVHGIPTDYRLKEGDILTVDVGMIYRGFHTDTAWTKIVQTSDVRHQTSDEKERFLETGKIALKKAIEQARVGNRIGHISRAIESIVLPAGYSIVRSLVGHGVGRTLHEEPQIPGLLKAPLENTPLLTGGETIAIEVIYAKGKGELAYDPGGWSIRMRDSSTASVFEHTIAVTSKGPLVLTRSSLNAPQGEQSIG